MGQSSSVGMSGRSQPTSSFVGGRGLLGNGMNVGGIGGLGSSVGNYPSQSPNASRSVGGVLGGAGVTGPNVSVYDRPRGRSPYR